MKKSFWPSIYSLGLIWVLAASVASQGPEDQPSKVTGQFDYKSAIVPKYFSQGASALLLCVTDSLIRPSEKWLPKSEQIVGRFTTPIGKAPLRYEIDLPLLPGCTSIDIDNNGEKDNGVQVFVAANAINLFGDSYLEQLEQESAFYSVLTDPNTQSIRKGTLLIYAPDNSQKVPIGFGADGKLFTRDDPTIGVAAGYSLMIVNNDRTISFDNTNFPRMDILEPEEGKNPDLSSQGLLQSFDSLIDLLKERYAYTELRKIDWEKKRSEFRPRFAEADRQKDLQLYFIALHDFASSIRDGHVQTASYDPSISGKRQEMLAKRYSGRLGASVIRYSDGRFVVVSVGKDSPAEKAGFKTGTEILRVNGKSVVDHLNSIPALGFYGTDERALQLAARFIFSFPTGESVAVEYKQAGETVQRTVTMVAGDFDDGPGIPEFYSTDPIQIKKVGEGQFGYFRWADFENVPLVLAALETFLVRSKSDKGVIFDLRGNGGGLLGLMYTMASYMFPAEKAVSLSWLDTYTFDDAKRTFVRSPGDSLRKISSPRAELAYEGEVVVLVDGASASSAEFFSQFLQRQKRATVISDSGTDGAGGTVRAVILPGNIPFTYTGGRMFYAGTQEVNLEGKGVTPDIRVPINDEYVKRRIKGEDVVLESAIQYLSHKTANK